MKKADRLQTRVIKLYIDMRLKRLSRLQWLTETEQTIEELLLSEHTDVIPELFQAQLLITKQSFEEAQELMDMVAEWLRGHSQQAPVCHAYYLYLTTLLGDDAAYDMRVTAKLKELAQKNPALWQISWLLFYVDASLEEPLERYHFLKGMFLRGCRSPLMYLEARALLERNPMFLYEFSEFEIQLAAFLIRHAGMSERVCEILEEYMLQRTDYRYLYLIVLRGCYELMPSKRLLEGICRVMVSGGCIGDKFSYWYRKGIQEGVSLSGLYEAYMKSLPVEKWCMDDEALSDARRIPPEVLEYFAYTSGLDHVRTAYLYAFIHKYRDNWFSIYQAYEPLLMPFVLSGLYAGSINAGLAYLYENVLHLSDIPKECMETFLDICHTCRVTGALTKTGVLRVHYRHISLVTEAELCDGEALLPLYGREYELEVIDQDGRALQQAELCVLPMLDQARFTAFFDQNVVTNRLYRMAQTEEAIRQKDTRLCLAVVKEVLEEKEIRTEFKQEAAALVFPYWDINGMHEELANAGQYVFIRTGSYEVQEETRFWLEQYQGGRIGIYGVRFLMEHYNGSLHELAGIFTRSSALGIQNGGFAQRLLLAMAETRQLLPQYADIFEAYCKESDNLDFIQGFLEFAAKESYIKGEKLPDSMMRKQAELTQAACEPDVPAMLAYLYTLTEAGLGNCTEDTAFAARHYVKALLEKNIYFSWMQQLKGLCPMLAEKEAFTVLEYRGRTDGPIWVRYAKYSDTQEEPDSFESDVMDIVCEGICSKAFILFYGERLRYDILMLDGTDKKILKQGILQRGQEMEKSMTGRFSKINHMLFLREKHEDKQLYAELEAYYRQKTMTEQLFTLK